MNCEEFRHSLDAYLAGDLVGSAGEEAGRHAAACVDCARDAERQRALSQIVQARFADASFEVDLWPTIRERIEDQPAPSSSKVAWWALSGAAAASLVAAMLLRSPQPDAAAISIASVSKAEREYAAAIHIASAEFRRRETTLPADTVASVESALRAMDLGIAAVRAEWQRTPDDAEVATWLEHAYATKLDLLVRSVER